MRDARWLLLGPVAAIVLVGGVALGAVLDPLGDNDAGPPETIELATPPPVPTPPVLPTPPPVPAPSPPSPPPPEPTVVVTEIPVPAVTQVFVPVEADPGAGEAEELLEEARQIYQAWVDYCAVLVSPDVGEAVETLQKARRLHQLWVDYLEDYPDQDPPNDGMTRDERLALEREWVAQYDRILLLLQQAAVGCSLPPSEGG